LTVAVRIFGRSCFFNRESAAIAWWFVNFRFLLSLLHIRALCRTVTWCGKADGRNGAHIDAGPDTAALRAKLKISGDEVKLVRRYADKTQLVEAKSGKGLAFLEADQVFKWTGPVNTGSDIEGLVVQVPTGRCGSKFSADSTMKNALLHKNVKSFDVTLLYGVPSLFLPHRAHFGQVHGIKIYKKLICSVQDRFPAIATELQFDPCFRAC
jgi:hypothetical protein